MTLPNPETLVTEISQAIAARLTPNTALVGIYTGGVWVMEKVLAELDQEIPFGKLDAAMYRDDVAARGLKAQNKPSWMPFDVTGKDIILIDDIFYTGRTTRAAMNELFDHGRPASITLAVLINRGGSELPISPQIVGADVPLEAEQLFLLTQDTQGQLHLSLENKQTAGGDA